MRSVFRVRTIQRAINIVWASYHAGDNERFATITLKADTTLENGIFEGTELEERCELSLAEEIISNPTSIPTLAARWEGGEMDVLFVTGTFLRKPKVTDFHLLIFILDIHS